MRHLRMCGEHPRSASSPVSAAGAAAARQRIAAERERRARLHGPRTGNPSRRSTTGQRPARSVADGAPSRAASGRDDDLDLAARMFGRERHTLRPAVPPRPPRGQSYEPLTAWRLRWFSAEEEQVWRAHGVHDPEQALLCLRWELTPRVLEIEVDGDTAGGWLQSGEGPGQVVARLRSRGLWPEPG